VNRVQAARKTALDKYGPKLSEQDQMKAKSYQNHEDQAAGWQANAYRWGASYNDCEKVRKATMTKLG
jgi:hypothetical protein